MKVVDVNTNETYGEAEVAPTVDNFAAQCPEGVTVKGIVITIRGNEAVAGASNEVTIPFEPLAGATDLMLAMPQVNPLRR